MRFIDHVVARTLTFVLAGGEGRRLAPLTKSRPKPLVPFGGCYRIIDFVLSNCCNSGLRRVNVLTQHESETLAGYLRKGWSWVGPGSREFLISSPPAGGRHYAGTADAVFQNLPESEDLFILVVPADHICKLDYREIIAYHAASGAQATMAVSDSQPSFSSDSSAEFVEISETGRVNGITSTRNGASPVNMGVYVFNPELLLGLKAKNQTFEDLSSDLIPRLISSCDVHAYRHEDPLKSEPRYWRDIGTPENYYAAAMDLLATDPPVDLTDRDWPIRSADRGHIDGHSSFCEEGRDSEINSLIPNGATIGLASVYRSVLSSGVVLDTGVDVRHSILMPGVVVGRGATIRRAIIDSNVVIEPGDEIGYNPHRDRRRFHVLENGVVLVSADTYALGEARMEWRNEAVGGRKARSAKATPGAQESRSHYA
jgi:glucose-1-phosphate adenylyltransferase